MNEKLAAYAEIQPDSPEEAIPSLSGKARWTLNRQTGFNRSLLAASNECGCFYCGRRFPTALVKDWLTEPGEEDTGLCPYCGKDALIVGDEEHPLTTALLALLYEDWFGSGLRQKIETATVAPSFTSWDDYMRKGIPFQLGVRDGRRAVGEIAVFSVGCRDYENGGLPRHPGEILCGFEPGGEWKVQSYFDEKYQDYEYMLVRDEGISIPFEPWGESDLKKVKELISVHGEKLLGLFCDTSYGILRLCVLE